MEISADPPPRLLAVIWHSRTGAARAMAAAAVQGAGVEMGGALPVAAEVATAEIIVRAAGYLFVCPENLGTMSGMMKEMFDRTYYALAGGIAGRPYATAIAAGSDGTGATRQIDRIATGWRLRRIADPLIVNLAAQSPDEILAEKIVTPFDLNRCRQLGEAFAEGLRLGIF